MIAICLPIGSKSEPKTENCLSAMERFTNEAARKRAAAELGSVPTSPLLASDWMTRVEQRAAQLGAMTFRVTGVATWRARNMLTEKALAAGASHILSLDGDMRFPVDALARLLAHRLPVVGGLYFNRRPPFQPQILKVHDESCEVGRAMGCVYDYPKNTLVDCDATGAGFVLIERRVFEALPDGHWWDEYPGDGDNGGAIEDISFCIRARQAGFRVVVDTGLKLGHIGELEVDESFAERFRAGHSHYRHNVWMGRRAPRARPPSTQAASTDVSAPDSDHPGKGEVTSNEIASIVIPTRDAPPKFLRAAIMSALDQDYEHTEVIVVDDGSGTPDVIPSEAKLVKLPQPRGIPEALNVGIREAAGDWIFVLQPTDLADPARVHTQLEAVSASGQDCNFCPLDVHLTRNAAAWITNMVPRWWTLEAQLRYLAEAPHIQTSGLMFHRSIWQKVGLFNPDFPTLYVWDWAIRATLAGVHIYKVEDTLGVERKGIAHRIDGAEALRVQAQLKPKETP